MSVWSTSIPQNPLPNSTPDQILAILDSLHFQSASLPNPTSPAISDMASNRYEFGQSGYIDWELDACSNEKGTSVSLVVHQSREDTRALSPQPPRSWIHQSGAFSATQAEIQRGRRIWCKLAPHEHVARQKAHTTPMERSCSRTACCEGWRAATRRRWRCVSE